VPSSASLRFCASRSSRSAISDAATRIGKLFAGGNDAETRGERLGELALDPIEAAAGRVEQDPALRLAHLGARVRADHHLRRRGVHHVRQLASDAVRIEIDGRDDLQIVLLQRAASDAAADGPRPISATLIAKRASCPGFRICKIPGRRDL